ncbi:MAG: anaerobic ribonucleoside-triphosphate reductase activating protein [Bacteroidota bacterium]|nr:anaerobic ribonucleoside-triphosphate reductase activating protein [Bacteroidota bacterium]
MQIGGFVKQSLIDYPGKIAAIVFTQGCNFRCGYCHNPGLVLPELFHQNQAISVNEVLCYLQERKDWLDGVVVTGGEPTIHKDLPEFLKKIKNLGYLVKLDTNGSNPSMLEHIIKESLADYIAMDIKTTLNATNYSQITGIGESDGITEKVIASIDMLKNSNIETEFRTTKLPGIHTSDILNFILDYLGKNSRYTVNDFRDGEILSSYN